MTDKSASRWQFRIDRGGTFTDIVARRSERRTILNPLLYFLSFTAVPLAARNGTLLLPLALNSL